MKEFLKGILQGKQCIKRPEIYERMMVSKVVKTQANLNKYLVK
jgi:hypothetical protein